MTKKINLTDSFEEFDFSVNKAIMSLTGLDQEAAKETEKGMEFDDYTNFIMAIERDDKKSAMKYLAKYHQFESVSLESIHQELAYLIKEDADCVLVPSFMKLCEEEVLKLLETMDHKQTQKILANLRGFAHPGYHEMTLTHATMHEEIAALLCSGTHKLDEIMAAAPGVTSRQQAYGAHDPADEEAEAEEEIEDERNDMNNTQSGGIVKNQKDIANLKRLAGMPK